jgi:hypothetical protein
MRELFTPAIRLMNRLTYPQKFGLISLLFALPLALVLLFFITAMNDRISFAQKEIDGNAYLRPLRTLLDHTLADKLLALDIAPDGSVPAALQASVARIDADFQTLDRVDAQYGARLGTTAQLTALKAAWSALQARRRTDPADPELHTPFITGIRGLITQVGDTSNLTLDPDLDSHYVMDAVLLKLPEGQDRLAQTIALGERVLARGSMTPQERAQLIILGGLVQANRDETQRGLSIAFRNNPEHNLLPALDAPLRASSGATAMMVITLTEQVVKPGTITLDPLAYRAAGQEALARKFALWDQAIDQLE